MAIRISIALTVLLLVLLVLLAAPARGYEAHDPVCGTTVDTEAAPCRAEHAGRTYWFCAETCR